MAIPLTATWLLPLLLLATVQDCIGDDLLEQLDCTPFEKMEHVIQSLESLSDSVKKGNQLHMHNNEMLTRLSALPDEVETQTGEIQELKKLLSEKDKLIQDQRAELDENAKDIQQYAEKLQDLDTKLGESQLHVQQLEHQVKQLNETVNFQEVCSIVGKFSQDGRKIRELVHEFSSNGDWYKMKEGLEAMIVNSSEEYSQLERAGSVYMVGYYDYTQLASLLLCAGMPVDMTDSNGYTLLSGAAGGGHIQLVKMLLDRGANVNSKGYNDHTPLMLAAYEGHLDIVRVLVQAGADTTAKNKAGRTALDYARSEYRTAVEQYLEQYQH